MLETGTFELLLRRTFKVSIEKQNSKDVAILQAWKEIYGKIMSL